MNMKEGNSQEGTYVRIQKIHQPSEHIFKSTNMNFRPLYDTETEYYHGEYEDGDYPHEVNGSEDNNNKKNTKTIFRKIMEVKLTTKMMHEERIFTNNKKDNILKRR